MKRIAIIVLLLAVVTLAGCSTGKVDSQKIAEAEIDNRMFMVVSEELSGKVLVDKSTGVMYWMSDNSNNRGNLTLLVNHDGTPRMEDLK